MRRLLPFVLLVAGLLLVGGSVAAWTVSGRSDPGFGTLESSPDPVLAEATPSPEAPLTADATPSEARPPVPVIRGAAPALPRAGDQAAAPTVATRSARLDDREVEPPPPEPAQVALPRLDIAAAVEPVGVLGETGELAVPDDALVAGWYRHGAAAGADEGNAVLAAHVDSRAQGPGAFFRLGEARPGDEVLVTTAQGEALRYAVEARQQVAKDALPAEVFARSGPHRLVLVTCGGRFVPAAGRYEDNVVIVARPVGG